MWRIISSKVIFKHPRITLVEDEVELPNQQRTTYLKFADNGGCGATIIAKRQDGKILVEREYSHPPQRWMYQLPGGGVRADEDIFVGANRELMEECNLSGDLTLIGKYFMDNRRSAAPMNVFVAQNLKKAPLDGDLEEEIELYWFSEKEIDELIASGRIDNGPMLAAWAVYKTNKILR